MPIVKVWCLPPRQSEKKLKKLFEKLLAAITSVKELGLSKKSITCLFPPDLMKYGLGTEIIIEIDGLFQKPERTRSVRQRLANTVAYSVKLLYPGAKVECFVRTFNPKDGFCVLPAKESRKNILMCIDKIHECHPTGGPECFGCGG
jgi:phenylpyruvate tautomerase PptA (4-oxalocrotonate tautomerase family)